MTARVLRVPRFDFSQRPFIVIWEATRACALACLHCRAEAQPLRSRDELSTAQAKALMDEVLSFGAPPPFFVITGGDPFMRPDLAELVRHGTSIGLPVAVSPSGTPTLTRANLAEVAEAGARAVSLSVDGADAAAHDAFRGVPGSFEATLRGWDDAQDLGMKVQINTTVTPGNLAALPDLLALVHGRGVLTWSLFFLVPTGRGSSLAQLGAQQAEDALHFCYDANEIVSVKTTEHPAFRRVGIQRRILLEEGTPVEASGLTGPDYAAMRRRMAVLGLHPGRTGPRRPPLPIGAGQGFVFVSHTGQVHPSGFLPLPAGAVGEQPLAGIYRDSDLMRRVRDRGSLTGRCGRCEFAAVCGGSRSRAYGATADLAADDPLCGYLPDSFGRSERVAQLLGG